MFGVNLHVKLKLHFCYIMAIVGSGLLEANLSLSFKCKI